MAKLQVQWKELIVCPAFVCKRNTLFQKRGLSLYCYMMQFTCNLLKQKGTKQVEFETLSGCQSAIVQVSIQGNGFYVSFFKKMLMVPRVSLIVCNTSRWSRECQTLLIYCYALMQSGTNRADEQKSHLLHAVCNGRKVKLEISRCCNLHIHWHSSDQAPLYDVQSLDPSYFRDTQCCPFPMPRCKLQQRQLINSFRNAMITRFEHELKKSELDKVDEKKMSTKRGLKAKYQF